MGLSLRTRRHRSPQPPAKTQQDREGDDEDQVQRAARRFLLYYKKLTPIVYTSVKDSGVLLTIRHLCLPRERRGVSERIWESILDEFARRPNIDFAYPTQRFYDNRVESKPVKNASLEWSGGADGR